MSVSLQYCFLCEVDPEPERLEKPAGKAHRNDFQGGIGSLAKGDGVKPGEFEDCYRCNRSIKRVWWRARCCAKCYAFDSQIGLILEAKCEPQLILHFPLFPRRRPPQPSRPRLAGYEKSQPKNRSRLQPRRRSHLVRVK